jgi:hypothetical protein
MEYELKRISTAGIAAAIAKVEHYRSLNQPEEAESICRDILTVEPEHQDALRLLGLALTDQFTGGPSDRVREAEELFLSLTDTYQRFYYSGIAYERRAKAQLRNGQPMRSVLPLLEQGLHSFAEAERIKPEGNDDALLRWNRCVRLLQSMHYTLQEEGVFEAFDAPPA